MEINVTFIRDEEPAQFSDSIYGSGLSNIGAITWRNACAFAEDHPLVTPEQQADLRDWILEFGAWDAEEVAAMTDEETNALLLQFVAGDHQQREDARERGELESWEENCGGRLYEGGDGQLYFYVGV